MNIIFRVKKELNKMSNKIEFFLFFIWILLMLLKFDLINFNNIYFI